MAVPPGFRTTQIFTVPYSSVSFSQIESQNFANWSYQAPMSERQVSEVRNKLIARSGDANSVIQHLCAPYCQPQAVTADLLPYQYANSITDMRMIFSSQSEKEIRRIDRLLQSNAGIRVLQTALADEKQFQLESMRYLIACEKVPLLALESSIIQHKMQVPLAAEICNTGLIQYFNDLLAPLTPEQQVSILRCAPDTNDFWKKVGTIQGIAYEAKQLIYKQLGGMFHCQEFTNYWHQCSAQEEEEEEDIEGAF